MMVIILLMRISIVKRIYCLKRCIFAISMLASIALLCLVISQRCVNCKKIVAAQLSFVILIELQEG